MNKEIATIYAISYDGQVVYVGSTSRSPSRRFSQHLTSTKRKTKFARWIEDKDRTKFLMHILEICPGEVRYERESFWIEEKGTRNLFNTDEAPKPTKEKKQKEKKETKPKKWPGRPKGSGNPTGPEHYLYGKKVARHVVDASVAARIGKPLSEEHKAKQRAAHAANRHLYSYLKKVKCDQTDQVWDSIAEASRFFGVREGTIQHRIKNKEIKRVQNKALGGLTFSYVKDNE